MPTIQIAHEASEEKMKQVRAHLDEVALRDPNWNGADFRIERDDFTCIPDDESPDAVSLLMQIERIIDGQTDDD